MSSSSENSGRERVWHELRAVGAKDTTSQSLRSGIHTRGYLPHVKCEGADYFVTFRLADSLPKEVLLRYEAVRAARFKALLKTLHRGQAGQATSDTEEIIQRDFYRQVERCLDQGAGTCHLRRADIASLMAGALTFFHGQRYFLREWVVMPNHVHVLFWPAPNHLVGEIVKSWK